MIIQALIEYEDPMDNSLPPQIYIRKWVKVVLTPIEWYNVLSNPCGNKYYRI